MRLGPAQGIPQTFQTQDLVRFCKTGWGITKPILVSKTLKSNSGEVWRDCGMPRGVCQRGKQTQTNIPYTTKSADAAGTFMRPRIWTSNWRQLNRSAGLFANTTVSKWPLNSRSTLAVAWLSSTSNGDANAAPIIPWPFWTCALLKLNVLYGDWRSRGLGLGNVSECSGTFRGRIVPSKGAWNQHVLMKPQRACNCVWDVIRSAAPKDITVVSSYLLRGSPAMMI